MGKYPIQADIAHETWYIEVHADSPEQAVEEGKWMIKRIANVSINTVLNARVESLDFDDVKV
jgi:hypothetical protein